MRRLAPAVAALAGVATLLLCGGAAYADSPAGETLWIVPPPASGIQGSGGWSVLTIAGFQSVLDVEVQTSAANFQPAADGNGSAPVTITVNAGSAFVAVTHPTGAGAGGPAAQCTGAGTNHVSCTYIDAPTTPGTGNDVKHDQFGIRVLSDAPPGNIPVCAWGTADGVKASSQCYHIDVEALVPPSPTPTPTPSSTPAPPASTPTPRPSTGGSGPATSTGPGLPDTGHPAV